MDHTARATRVLAAWVPGIFFAALAATPAPAQLGHVVSAVKISDTSGGFTAELDEQDQFGRSIVNLGDLNGDGVTDLLVGAHTDDDGPGGLDRGAVYVLFLRQNGSVLAWQKISDQYGNFSGRLDPSDQFGRAAANLGDLDGDGVIDLAVSSNYDDDGGTNRGAVYILFLNPDGTVKGSQKISSTQGGLPASLKNHDEFGRSIASLGDLDGDGLTDIVVGTPEDDDGGTNTGALHVLFLNANGTVKDYRRISRSSSGLRIRPGDWFGHCLANLGDFDGDGVNDIAVGAVLDDDGGVNQGSLWVLFLRKDGSVKSASEINELVGGFSAPLDDIDQFGTSVSALGDLDGDGVTDLAVGAVKDDDGGLPGDLDADVGAVYVLFMRSDATVRSWVKISDTSGDLPYPLDRGDWFGSALARLGGSSLDGLFNLAAGCRFDNDGGGNHGAIYLLQLNDGTAPVAQFSAGPLIGPAPLTVAFTDQSAGAISAWLWSFGDGRAPSQQQHPGRTFETPGDYTVRLDVRGPKGSDRLIRSAYVKVTGPGFPDADFALGPLSGAAPLAVSFQDLSTGDVTAWDWQFGDGRGSSEQHPTHVYAEPGTYSVTLTATGPLGANAELRADAVLVTSGAAPRADFTSLASNGIAPLRVDFRDLSTGTITGYAWDFGDGGTSDDKHPSHTYDEVGVYTVSLTVTGPGGSDTLTQIDLVNATEPPPAADFQASATGGLAPLTVAFTDLSTLHVTSWAWDFGDGGSSSEQHPTHVYSASGLYTVGLTVTSAGGQDSELKNDLIAVQAAAPVVAFEALPTGGPAPLAVTFTDLSTGEVSSWSWDFGDGGSSPERHPTHTYLAPGAYTVTLTAAGPGGADALARTDLVLVGEPAPVALFEAAPTAGVAPLAVLFEDLTGGAVTSWDWQFGDGERSSEPGPTHVYALPGLYAVTLKVAGPGGSHSLTRADLISILEPPPVAAFDAAPRSGPAPLAVLFSDLSSGSVTGHTWDFGDGTSSSEPEPLHVYQEPGLYSVSLSVTGPGGTASARRDDFVSVSEAVPVADFSAAPRSGYTPLRVSFRETSSGLTTSGLWDFGDGTNSTLRHPEHVYVAPGLYDVRLEVNGPGGSDVEWKPAFVEVLPLPEFGDGGFEQQVAGAAPGAPWSVFNGTAILVLPGPIARDGPIPSEGAQWCQVGADGSSAAQPPSNPLGQGLPPRFAAALRQDFRFDPASPHLLFDAVFVLAGPPASSLLNDFMSVDLTDGTTTWNVYYRDTFSLFPKISALDGLPMTELETVAVDLAALYPAATETTVLSLQVAVGNGGTGSFPSRGYVDGFRLAPPAAALFRNGSGLNAPCYLAGPPVLGGSWTVEVDASSHPGAALVYLLGYDAAHPGLALPAGEVLVDAFGGLQLLRISWPSSGGLDRKSFTLPLRHALIGRFAATQAVILGGGTELCNAFDLTLGL
jgi:PKD repeat protein